MKKILLASILAATSAFAQTGDWGRAVGTDTIGKTCGYHSILLTVLMAGVTIAVWLYAYKLWKEIKHLK